MVIVGAAFERVPPLLVYGPRRGEMTDINDLKPKAVRDGYAPVPFFFRQTNDEGDARIVAWTASIRDLQAVFKNLIERLPERTEVLLKIRRESAEELPPDVDLWRRSYGIVHRHALLEAIDRCESFVFRDSRNQLCVRDPETLDYIVLDDAGVIYVYSHREEYCELLLQHGLEKRIESLISDAGHWRQEPADGLAAGVEFCRLLQLEDVPGPNESHNSGGAITA